jgi:hypothetical protein
VLASFTNLNFAANDVEVESGIEYIGRSQECLEGDTILIEGSGRTDWLTRASSAVRETASLC